MKRVRLQSQENIQVSHSQALPLKTQSLVMSNELVGNSTIVLTTLSIFLCFLWREKGGSGSGKLVSTWNCPEIGVLHCMTDMLASWLQGPATPIGGPWLMVLHHNLWMRKVYLWRLPLSMVRTVHYVKLTRTACLILCLHSDFVSHNRYETVLSHVKKLPTVNSMILF